LPLYKNQINPTHTLPRYLIYEYGQGKRKATPMQDTKVLGEAEVQLHEFIALERDGGER